MEIKKNITGETYKNLITYACKKCNILQMTFRNDGFNASEKAFLKERENSILSNFKENLIKIEKNIEWENFHYENNTLKEGIYYLFYFFKIDKKIEEYLLTNKDLYKWLNPEYPEDIAFFKDDSYWLYSVAHEDMCDIYCENEEEYEYLKSIGVEFVEENFVPKQKETE